MRLSSSLAPSKPNKMVIEYDGTGLESDKGATSWALWEGLTVPNISELRAVYMFAEDLIGVNLEHDSELAHNR